MLLRGIGDPLSIPVLKSDAERCWAGVLRAIWMSAGPALVVLATIQLIDASGAERRAWELCYVVAAGLTAVARLVGWILGDRRTLSGRPMPGTRLAVTLAGFCFLAMGIWALGAALSVYSGNMEQLAAVDQKVGKIGP
jgi:hypothetical protein